MMTKKDYIRAAKIVNALFVRSTKMEKEATDAVSRASAEMMVVSAGTVMGAFVLFFQDDNPRFDTARFEEACKA